MKTTREIVENYEMTRNWPNCVETYFIRIWYFFGKFLKEKSKNLVMTVAPLYLNLLIDVIFQHVVSYLFFHVGPLVVGFQVLVHLGTTTVHEKLGLMCFLQNLPFNHLVVRNTHTLSHN
jgi:hypothetical protein